MLLPERQGSGLPSHRAQAKEWVIQESGGDGEVGQVPRAMITAADPGKGGNAENAVSLEFYRDVPDPVRKEGDFRLCAFHGGSGRNQDGPGLSSFSREKEVGMPGFQLQQESLFCSSGLAGLKEGPDPGKKNLLGPGSPDLDPHFLFSLRAGAPGSERGEFPGLEEGAPIPGEKENSSRGKEARKGKEAPPAHLGP